MNFSQLAKLNSRENFLPLRYKILYVYQERNCKKSTELISKIAVIYIFIKLLQTHIFTYKEPYQP